MMKRVNLLAASKGLRLARYRKINLFMLILYLCNKNSITCPKQLCYDASECIRILINLRAISSILIHLFLSLKRLARTTEAADLVRESVKIEAMLKLLIINSSLILGASLKPTMGS